MRQRWWFRWVIALALIVVLAVVGVRAAIGAVQDPYLVQSRAQESDGWRVALYVVKRDHSSADVATVIKDFAQKDGSRPLVAEFYTDGAAAASFEGGGPADTAQTAAQHVGEFTRPASGAGKGWADAKGAQDAGKVAFSVP